MGCTQVLLTECRRRSPLLPHPPSRSRSLLHQRESTPSGSEDPSLLPSPPSSRCGSPSRSMMNAAQPLSTASASKYFCQKIPFHLKSTIQPRKTSNTYRQFIILSLKWIFKFSLYLTDS